MVAVFLPGPPLEQIRPPDGFAEVLPKLLLAGHEQDTSIPRLVYLVADGVFHASRARGSAFAAIGRVAVDILFGPLVALPALDPIPVEVCSSIGLRELESAAFSRRTSADHRGQDRERAVHRPSVDADAGVLLYVGVSVVVDPNGDLARPRVVRDAVARHVSVRTGRPVSRY